MAEQVSTTVTSSSNGKVTLALEAYQDLERRAQVKPAIQNTYVTKTPEMQAVDNMAWGAVMGFGGLCLSLIGTGMHLLGRRQASKLKKR